MTTPHIHEFRKSQSKSVEICVCGKWRFTKKWIETQPSFVNIPPETEKDKD